MPRANATIPTPPRDAPDPGDVLAFDPDRGGQVRWYEHFPAPCRVIRPLPDESRYYAGHQVWAEVVPLDRRGLPFAPAIQVLIPCDALPLLRRRGRALHLPAIGRAPVTAAGPAHP